MLSFKEKLCGRFPGITFIQLYLVLIAFFVFIGISFGPYGSYAFDELSIIPCMLFLCTVFRKPVSSAVKRMMGLSILFLAWFLFLQVKRNLEYLYVYPFGPYFCAYLLAFPLASMMEDGKKKRGLKLFFAAFVAASVSHMVSTGMLFADAVPYRMQEYHLFWDSSRLNSFWHPNMTACFLMFGIAGCIAFLQSAKTWRVKVLWLAVLLLTLAVMALTNCRTIIILTGGILGGSVFYTILKGRWKLAPLALIAAVAILVLVYKGCGVLYKAHTDHLFEKQHASYAEDASAIEAGTETEDFNRVTNSSQQSLVEDLSSFNSRSIIWNASFMALKANRSHFIFGVDNPGTHLSYFNTEPQPHAHNAWIETLMGLGIPGLAIALVFTLLTIWNGILILLKYPLDVWKRTTAMVTLCMLVASFLEPYLFLPPSNYYLYNFIFLLCLGYLVHWQAEDNQKILQGLCKRLRIGSK